jgi:drug/metabolite transporter (DMT)-like permease
VLVGVLGLASFGFLGRGVARAQEVDTMTLMAVPLAFGGGILLIIAGLLEGWPALPLAAWVILLTLAGINTALAYILYNHALRSLTALEMNMLLSLSPLATAVFAWLLLKETLNKLQVVGLIIVIVGVVVVQAGSRHTAEADTEESDGR